MQKKQFEPIMVQVFLWEEEDVISTSGIEVDVSGQGWGSFDPAFTGNALGGLEQ